MDAPVIKVSFAPKPKIGKILSKEKSCTLEKAIINIAIPTIGAIIELHFTTAELPYL